MLSFFVKGLLLPVFYSLLQAFNFIIFDVMSFEFNLKSDLLSMRLTVDNVIRLYKLDYLPATSNVKIHLFL